MNKDTKKSIPVIECSSVNSSGNSISICGIFLDDTTFGHCTDAYATNYFSCILLNNKVPLGLPGNRTFSKNSWETLDFYFLISDIDFLPA